MDIINKLATSLNRRDEVPNQELAAEIIKTKDAAAIKELVALLSHKNKSIQSDSIKVLYEIGEQQPTFIAPYVEDFVQLLDSKNNRLQWGAMSALNTITGLVPSVIYGSIGKIAAVADAGSVITKDNYVAMLIKLCSDKAYASDAFALLNEQLLACATNQLPMYAENAMPIINQDNKELFITTLTSRLPDIEKETKRKRVEKVIKKLQSK